MTSSQPVNLKSLSIRLSTDGLSFCVYAPAEAQPYIYKEYKVSPIISMAANLKEALQTEELLKQEYQRVNVLISTPEFTTVPALAFQREDVNDVFRFVFPKSGQQHVSYNVLRRAGIAIIFGLDKHIHQLLLDDFPRARFYASASTLIEFFSERSLIGANKKMYVYLHDEEMALYCFDQGRMLFVNTYAVRGVNDCQYYILNVWKQMGMEQIDDALCIVDDGDLSNQLADKIRYFIKNVSLIDRTEDVFRTHLGTDLQGVTKSANLIPYDLQTLLVCGY